MPRYIDADELKQKFINADADGINLAIDRYAIKCIDDAPTADVQPVVHGHWIKITEDFDVDEPLVGRCSVCGWSATYEDNVVGMNYCPNCGNPMDE